MDPNVLSIELPKGFRFSPRDEELIDFLELKIKGKEFKFKFIPEVDLFKLIPEVDLCNHEPSELPSLSALKNDDLEWYFFWRLNKKYPKGPKSDRATKGGYWKVQGKHRKIRSRFGKKLIGTKTTLVFHRGRARKGQKSQKTDWRIHEYRITAQDAFVLCRLFDKSENAEYSNGEDIEPTESSPTTTTSFPEGTPSNRTMVQTTLRPVEELNNMSSDASVPDGRHGNNNMAFQNVEDNEVIMINNQVDLPNAPTLETVDPKIFSPLHVDMCTGEGCSNPYYYTNGFQFQDVADDYDPYDPSFKQFLDSVIMGRDAEVAQEQAAYFSFGMSGLGKKCY